MIMQEHWDSLCTGAIASKQTDTSSQAQWCVATCVATQQHNSSMYPFTSADGGWCAVYHHQQPFACVCCVLDTPSSSSCVSGCVERSGSGQAPHALSKQRGLSKCVSVRNCPRPTATSSSSSFSSVPSARKLEQPLLHSSLLFAHPIKQSHNQVLLEPKWPEKWPFRPEDFLRYDESGNIV